MQPQVLLAQLRALMERLPDFEQYTPFSKEHQIWLAQAHALVSRYDSLDAIELKGAADLLSVALFRDQNVAKILGTVNRAIASLELDHPIQTHFTFAGGDVYDFFRVLGEIIASATASIFVVDPYLDASVFDHYLSRRRDGVTVRMLLDRYATTLQASLGKYLTQHGNVLEARKSGKLHDRIVFIDGLSCWLLGQSLKDAAKAKPTYLVPLPPDVVPAKLALYEEIWASADGL